MKGQKTPRTERTTSTDDVVMIRVAMVSSLADSVHRELINSSTTYHHRNRETSLHHTVVDIESHTVSCHGRTPGASKLPLNWGRFKDSVSFFSSLPQRYTMSDKSLKK